MIVASFTVYIESAFENLTALKEIYDYPLRIGTNDDSELLKDIGEGEAEPYLLRGAQNRVKNVKGKIEVNRSNALNKNKIE